MEYLERTPNPRFELASRKVGVGEQEVIDLVSGASDNIQLALTQAVCFEGGRNATKLFQGDSRTGLSRRALDGGAIRFRMADV